MTPPPAGSSGIPGRLAVSRRHDSRSPGVRGGRDELSLVTQHRHGVLEPIEGGARGGGCKDPCANGLGRRSSRARLRRMLRKRPALALLGVTITALATAACGTPSGRGPGATPVDGTATATG